ncbi:MAG: anthranilate phosphoribosyltransferase, partial [Planctomycetota bacterium]|nr:anthranilate phosphoribosyltransferase [Planctomycetota bacterium]
MNTAESVAVVRQRPLTRGEARALFAEVLASPPPADALMDLLRAWAARGETAEEIAGAAEAMRGAMTPFEHAEPGAVDTCGTGGDGLGTFNISTTAALVAAAAGVKIVKHGNRAASSQCGSADLLEAAGVQLQLDAAAARVVFEECGFVFLYAPAFHPALAPIAPVRRALGIRTIFNYLGPLCNPGRVTRQLLGVSDAARLADYAQVLATLGCEHGAVVHGAGGADELMLEGPNLLLWIGGRVPNGGASSLPAREFGIRPAPVSALAGGDAACNLALLERVLDGES